MIPSEKIAKERKREDDLERMKKILNEHGIKMSVGGCGCCGSPWVSFEYKGEVLFDGEEQLTFKMK